MLSKNSVFVIGLDGATFDLLRPLMDAGIMPQLQNLIEAGTSGVLRSAIPPVSGPAWASFQTGTNPGKHGLVDFLHYRPGSYEPALISSKAIQSQTVWSILSEHGRRVCVVNVPVTYPPQPVNGYLISGFLTPSTEAPFTHPPELREQLLANVPDYAIPSPVDITMSGVREFVQIMSDAIRQRWKAVRWLVEQETWDFFMVVFQATDLLQHALWDRLDSNHPGFAAHSSSERDLARRFYRDLDQIIGDLVQLADGSAVILMSDHGFGPARKRVYLNRWLVDHSYLALNASDAWIRMQAGFEDLVKRLDVLNLRRRLLPRDFRRRRAGLVRRVTQDPWIDWDHTRAFLFSGSTFGNLYVNRIGRYPSGAVTESEYERLRVELIECFQALVDPDTGQPVVDQVYRREEVFAGPMVSKLPDLIVRPHGGYLLETRFKGARLFDPMPQGITGLHRMDGICVFAGGPFVAQQQQCAASIVDLAPTILYLLGVPAPGWMDGRVLLEAIRPTYQPPGGQAVLDGRPGAVQDTPARIYSAEDESQVLDRLHGLGYL